MKPRTLFAPLAVALCAVASLFPSQASAHLIAAQQGTINLVGDSAFVVLSVPVSSLREVDDDGNGQVDQVEFKKHEAAIKEQIDQRLTVSDGSRGARTVSLDLVLSPRHEAASDRADQIVALKHAKFTAAPEAVQVRCDLFGAQPNEREVTFSATRKKSPEFAAERQTTTLAPGRTEHTFFHPTAPPPSAPVASAPSPAVPAGAPRGASFGFLLVFGVALGLSRKRLGAKGGTL